jgi:hypothetical protein
MMFSVSAWNWKMSTSALNNTSPRTMVLQKNDNFLFLGNFFKGKVDSLINLVKDEAVKRVLRALPETTDVTCDCKPFECVNKCSAPLNIHRFLSKVCAQNLKTFIPRNGTEKPATAADYRKEHQREFEQICGQGMKKVGLLLSTPC